MERYVLLELPTASSGDVREALMEAINERTAELGYVRTVTYEGNVPDEWTEDDEQSIIILDRKTAEVHCYWVKPESIIRYTAGRIDILFCDRSYAPEPAETFKLDDQYTAVIRNGYVYIACRRYTYNQVRKLWQAVKRQRRREKQGQSNVDEERPTETG